MHGQPGSRAVGEPATNGGLDEVDNDRLVARVAVAPVLALDGSRTTLRERWRVTTTVTCFVRQFGCLFCHQAVDDLVRSVPKILTRGARVAIVGNGSVEQARRFFAEKKLPRHGVDVLTDPACESYRAAGLEKGFAKTFLNGGSKHAYEAARREGHRITGWFGDLTQLGGLMLVSPPARLLYLHRSRFAGDHPDLGAVIALLPRPPDAPG